MDISVSLAYSAMYISLAFMGSAQLFVGWSITREGTLRLFSRSWVHHFARLGAWVLGPAMFFSPKSTQDLLMIGMFLCCQPAIVRWVIAADCPKANPLSLVRPPQFSRF